MRRFMCSALTAATLVGFAGAASAQGPFPNPDLPDFPGIDFPTIPEGEFDVCDFIPNLPICEDDMGETPPIEPPVVEGPMEPPVDPMEPPMEPPVVEGPMEPPVDPMEPPIVEGPMEPPFDPMEPPIVEGPMEPPTGPDTGQNGNGNGNGDPAVIPVPPSLALLLSGLLGLGLIRRRRNIA